MTEIRDNVTSDLPTPPVAGGSVVSEAVGGDTCPQPFAAPSPLFQVTAAKEIVGHETLPPWSQVKCRQCGQCCRCLILDASHNDVIREPRIAERGNLMNGRGELPADEWAWNLNGPDGTCVFLDRKTNLCTIYDTRPDMCIGMPAGGCQCMSAREEGNP